MSLLNFNFVIIYIVHKILVLIENYLNYLKDNIFECYFKKYIRLLFLLKKVFYSLRIIVGNPRFEEEKIIKDIRNLLRQEKETNETNTQRYQKVF